MLIVSVYYLLLVFDVLGIATPIKNVADAIGLGIV